jgi:hypothetical protein
MATLAVHSVAAAPIKPWVRRFVRIGYAAKGVIYFLIGILALRLAFGEGGRLTDQNGILHTIVRQPFGTILLSTIGVGLLAYSAWEIVRALLDRSSRGWADRALSIIKAFVYGAIGFHGIRLLFGDSARANNPDDLARTAMRLPLGEIVLALIGAGVAVYGVVQIMHAWKAEFDDDLDEYRVRRDGSHWVLTVGRAGIGSRGVILVLMGAAFVRAALSGQPAAAKGIPEALATVFAQQYGSLLLAAVAAGVMCYGIFQLLHARYARV